MKQYYVLVIKRIIFYLGAQNFDVIRFATYRTASKLRFIQKKLNRKYFLKLFEKKTRLAKVALPNLQI